MELKTHNKVQEKAERGEKNNYKQVHSIKEKRFFPQIMFHIQMEKEEEKDDGEDVESEGKWRWEVLRFYITAHEKLITVRRYS